MAMVVVEKVETPKGFLPCAYGMGALVLLEQKTGKKFGSILKDLQGDGISMELTCAIMWVGFYNGARKQKTKFEYDPMDVADWMDDIPELATECFALLTNSMGGNTDAEGNAEAALQPPNKKK